MARPRQSPGPASAGVPGGDPPPCARRTARRRRACLTDGRHFPITRPLLRRDSSAGQSRGIIIPRSLVQIQFPLPNKSNDIIGLGFKRRSPDRLFPFPGISGVSTTFRGFPGVTGVSMQQECSKRRLRTGEFRVVLLRRWEEVAVGVGGHLHGAIAHPQELSRFQAARMLAVG